MALGFKREDLQANATDKLRNADLLFRAGAHANAYYLGGYAIEMGLKACIAKNVFAETIPDKAIIKGILDHDFNKLVGLAGLAKNLRMEQNRDFQFAGFWAVVSEWNTDSRYEGVGANAAQSLLIAISHETSGVLTWIKTHW